MDDQPNSIRAQFRLQQHRTTNQPFALDVDINLPGNGISAIFGHSGSGKTTLLRCIAGLEKADQGFLTVKGETWQNNRCFLPTHKRPIGYVFQESSLFPHLTAQGNLDYAVKRANKKSASKQSTSKQSTRALFERVTTIMGITPILNQYPHQLSGGERQRVAIARALLIQPEILLMDEPLASLDMARKQEILPYLERLREGFDLPIIYVSHAMDEIARLADHAIALDEGKVIAQGTLQDVFSQVDSPIHFGEDTGVVISGQVTERDTRWHLSKIAFDGGCLWVKDGGDALNQKVRVRVLARDISLAKSCHHDSSILNRLEVTVAEIHQDQDPCMALVRLKSNSIYFIARITQRSLHQLKISEGNTIWAQIKSVALVR
ncbi:molybdenum ABC transporter ATP-binding protein [Litoribacillus peritrichatus]|uniref:Molybdenum ABC transporter ATP-binding protein n=1 Tax=Litoribacillus peritrichatus TaxID=718191 RepID=A0ABP7N0W6_9GAMM